MIVERKPRIGLLLIGSPRFKPLGEGTAHGTYEARKLREERKSSANFRKSVKSHGGNLFMRREGRKQSHRPCFHRKVDCVAAAYCPGRRISPGSVFLRDMPPVPLFFYQHHPGPGRDHRHQRRG